MRAVALTHRLFPPQFPFAAVVICAQEAHVHRDNLPKNVMLTHKQLRECVAFTDSIWKHEIVFGKTLDRYGLMCATMFESTQNVAVRCPR